MNRIMRKNLIVKASLFTLILAFMTIGTIVVAAVMKGDGKTVEDSRVQTTTWGLSSPSADPTDAENYVPFTGDPNELCAGEEEVCAVMAEDRGDGYPNLTSNLIQQINKQIPATDVHFRD